jgi:sugar O-acyltransferase (sialic acid O-acetyltransferase NeuD family)
MMAPFKYKVLGLGAGGHARVVLDAIQEAGEYEVVGLIDLSESTSGKSVDGVEILGSEARLEDLYQRGIRHVFNGIGGISDNTLHAEVYHRVVRQGFEFITVVHPKTTISKTVSIGSGSVLLAGAVVNAGTIIGANVVVNTNATVEHECLIGHHVHVAPGAILAGNVRVGDHAHIGAGAVVRQGIVVEGQAIVGAGAVVVKNVSAGTCVIGNPARPYYNYKHAVLS